MFSFVVALSASAIASPSISSEVESGVLMTIVTRPVRRTEVLLGKWLGLAALLAGYAGVVCALEFGVVDWVSGFVPPNPVLAGRLPVRRGGAAADAGAVLEHADAGDRRGRDRRRGVRRWMAGRSRRDAGQRRSTSLRCGPWGRSDDSCSPPTACGTRAIYYLQPPSLIAQHLAEGGNGDPFYAQGAPSWPYLLWVACWFLDRPDRRSGQLRAS